MLLRGMYWSPDDGGAGGSDDPPSPPRQQVAPQPAAAPPAPSSAVRQQESVADLRAEAAAYRIRARDTRVELEEAQRRVVEVEQQLESAKAAAVAPLQTKLGLANQKLIDASVQSAMLTAGLQDPDLVILASRMPNAPKVTLNDDYDVQGASELAEAFKKWKPEFFKKAAASDPPAGQGRTPSRSAPTPPNTSGGGEPPPSAGNGTVSVRGMDKKAYAAWKEQQLRGMRTPGNAGWGR